VVLVEARAAAAELPGFKHWKGNAGVDDMRLDSDIKRDVDDELSWDPDLDAIDIGVTVHNGVVTLGGFVGSNEDRVVHECHRRIRTSDRCS